MKNKDTPLDIITAIETASDEQLAALTRIENAINKNASPAGRSNGDPAEITVKVNRRSRTNPPPAADRKKAKSPEDMRRNVEKVRDKMLSPVREKREQENERLRDARGRFVSAESIGKAVNNGIVNARTNERTYKQDNQAGRERFTDKGLTSNVIDLKSAVKSLDKTVNNHNKDVVRIDKAGRTRDSNGRFLSKEKARELQRKKQDGADSAEGKAQEGFIARLNGALGSYNANKAEGEGGEIAGTAAGGVLWHMGRGAFDVGKSAYDSVASLNDFRKKAFGKEDVPADENTRAGTEENTHGNLAIKPAIAYPEVKPLAVDSSQKTFQQNANEAEEKATTAQTEALSRKDDQIIKNQEDEIELLRKIARGDAANDGLGRGLFDKLFGRKGARKGVRERLRERFGKKESKPAGHSEHTEKEGTGKPSAVKEASKPTSETPAEKGKANAVKTGGKTAAVTEKEATSKLSNPTVPKNLTSEAANDALGIGEKASIKTLAKGVMEKSAGTLMRGIPVIGQVVGAGIDASNGYSDTEGQQKAFNLKDGQEASTRQKSEMSAANVAMLGGLLPLASRGLSWVADKAGMEKTSRALDFDTSDVARSMDHGVTKAQDFGTSVKDFFTGHQADTPTALPDNSTQGLQASIKEGSDRTVAAINKLAKQLEGGKYGEDGVGGLGKSVSDYKAPATDNFTLGPNGLNIGGVHAKNRNFRNNNFGNLNFAGQDGAVLEDAPANGKARFARFNTPEEGMRALANQVSSYAHGTSKAAGYQKLDTVDKIISKWAPKGENDTDKYIQSVAGSLGVKPTDAINTDDPETMTRLIRSISTYEGGNPTVSDKTIRESIGNYDDRSGKWKGGKFSAATQEYLDKQAAKNGTAKIANNALVSVGKNATAIATHNAPNNIPNGINNDSGANESDKKSLSGSVLAQYEKGKVSSGINPNMGEIISHIGFKDSLNKAQNLAHSSDVSIVDYLEKKTGQHLRFRRPDAGLTLPEGNQPVPDGLKNALASKSISPAPSTSNPVATAPVNAPEPVNSGPVSVTSSDPVAGKPLAPVTSNQSPAASSLPVANKPQVKTTGGITAPEAGAPAASSGMVYSENGLISASRITPVTGHEQGLWDRTKSVFGDMADNVTKNAPSVLSSVGNAVLPVAKSALSGVAGGLGSSLSGAIKNPVLNSVAKPFISQGVNAANGAINSLSTPQAQPIFSLPRSMPAITDLSQSDSAASVQQPKSRTGDDVLAKSLQQLVDLTKQLLSNQKDSSKGEARPDVVVNGGQKKPKKDDHYNDSALDALMEDD